MNNSSDIILGFLIILVGLPLLILGLRDCIRQARNKNYSKIQKIGYVSAYIFGYLFIFFGIINFWTDLKQTSTPTPTASYIFDVVFIIYGLLIWATTRFQYRGGLWFIIGAFLVGGAFTGTVAIIEMHMRGWHYNSPLLFYGRIILCWSIGGLFLFIGHRRHKKKEAFPKAESEFSV